MPVIDWSSESQMVTCKFKNLYDSFLDNLVDFNLQQIVTTLTRKENVFDLFLINNPVQVHSAKTLPSLGTSMYMILCFMH